MGWLDALERSMMASECDRESIPVPIRSADHRGPGCEEPSGLAPPSGRRVAVDQRRIKSTEYAAHSCISMKEASASSANRSDEFFRKGYRHRWFFPHTVRYLPKGGPDGFKIARWMLGDVTPDQMWELVIHAGHSVAGQFPGELFFDDDVVWHQQQFGRPGQIATANLVVRGPSCLRWCTSPMSCSVSRGGDRSRRK